uniref:Uncharacterized protein n=1 Tax=Tanacetum cinerariifolium TaxID=118510 RepID=A0A699HG35_TANCI|nr:hypothetical protein [Tanacetum cinerariifolium]
MNLLNEGCSANPPSQNQPFSGYSSQFASMTPEQFQQHQQEQQQAFFRWQQSQVLNREFQDLQRHHHHSTQKLLNHSLNLNKSASTQFGELMEQELRLKREAAEKAFEVQAEKDRPLMRLEELRFLVTSTKDLDDADAYWIKKQQRLIRNKMRNDLGDEDNEDE